MNSVFTLMMSNSQMIQKDPGITKIITEFLGIFLNLIYNVVSNFTIVNSLGIAIILFTIVVRFMMLPLAVKQQKSMVKMQLMQPEVEKIKKKYGDSKDPEVQRKITAETQALYKEHGVSLFGGCVPLLIQMPIFFALSYMMNNAYLFINKIGDIYEGLALTITKIPNWDQTLATIASPKLTNKNISLDFNLIPDVEKVINRFSEADWITMLANAPADIVDSITSQRVTLDSIQFFGQIDLTRPSGYLWPGVLIPIFAVISTTLSSYIMQRMTPATSDSAKSQQKMMLIVMPLIMGLTTISLSAGVGLYWITSSIFQCIQQVVINKKVRKRPTDITLDIIENEEKATKKAKNEVKEIKKSNLKTESDALKDKINKDKDKK